MDPIKRNIKNKYKRLLSFLAALCLTAGLVLLLSLPVSANPGGGGTGTAADPFLINTLAQLRTFRNNVNNGTSYQGQHIMLNNNFNLETQDNNWVPIGNATGREFQGTFNGRGLFIRELTITSATQNSMDYGLFGRIGVNGTVQNLNLENVNINLHNNNNDVGGIAGRNDGTIRNCSVTGTITSVSSRVGGISGSNLGIIRDCWVNATVVAHSLAGGITGIIWTPGRVEFCYALGTVRANTNDNSIRVGGIVGFNSAGIVQRNVALQSSVFSRGSGGRVVAENMGTLTWNYGRSNMALTTVPSRGIQGGSSDIDGVSITLGTTANSTVFSGWDINIWNIPSGNVNSNNLPTFHLMRTVTYNGNGSTGGTVPVDNNRHRGTATALTNTGSLTRTGHTFAGWQTTATGGTAIAAGASFTITENTTLFARWTANSYNVRFNANGGTGTMADQPFTYGTAQNLRANTFTRTGYSFAGWSTVANGTLAYQNQASVNNLTTTNNGIFNLFARWTANNYTVTLDQQGGTGGSASVTTTFDAAMPSMTRPTREGYTFEGYWTQPNGTGTRYYNADGTSAQTWNIANSTTTLHANWTANNYTVTLDRQGGTGGSANITATFGAAMPGIIIPTRAGHTFGGYRTEPNVEGTRYYTAAGESARNWDIASDKTLYAQWTLIPIPIAMDARSITPGGFTTRWLNTTGAMSYLLDVSTEENFSSGMVLTGQTVTGVSFAVTGLEAETTYYYRVRAVNAGGTSNNSNVIAVTTAALSHTAHVYDLTGGDFAVDSTNLQHVLDNYIVTDEHRQNSETITLTLTVSEAENTTANAKEIIAASRGTDLQFFDITVTKQINEGNPVNLTELPVPIQVTIDLSPEMSGRTGYSVYRFHGGDVQLIGTDTEAEEYFTVSRGTGGTEGNRVDQVKIHTKRFSTYAVVDNTLTMGHSNITAGISNYEDFDVQARIHVGSAPVYKIDIEWGNMRFVYNLEETDGVWNPETGMNDGVIKAGWSGFTGGNNRITVKNHSNADVKVSFDITDNTLASAVYMDIYKTNEENGEAAVDMPLGKVPLPTNDARSIEAFLWLSGEPSPADIESLTAADVWHIIGIITVTITPDGDMLTPRQ